MRKKAKVQMSPGEKMVGETPQTQVFISSTTTGAKTLRFQNEQKIQGLFLGNIVSWYLRSRGCFLCPSVFAKSVLATMSISISSACAFRHTWAACCFLFFLFVSAGVEILTQSAVRPVSLFVYCERTVVIMILNIPDLKSYEDQYLWDDDADDVEPRRAFELFGGVWGWSFNPSH